MTAIPDRTAKSFGQPSSAPSSNPTSREDQNTRHSFNSFTGRSSSSYTPTFSSSSSSDAASSPTDASFPSPRTGIAGNNSPSHARSGLLSLASLARDKTASAISGLTSPKSTGSSSSLKSPSSISSLRRQGPGGAFSPIDSPTSNTDSQRTSNSTFSSSDQRAGISSTPDPRTSVENPFASPPISRTASPAPSNSSAGAPTQLPFNKMHQTSSRLLRMTDEERPFTRDFKDLFSTLMVSLPLNAHRVRFRNIDFTFTSDEAINNLGSLKFSQSNRMPDPKDPSRIVTTTTTTTFSMAREMARSVCQRFMDARFIEPADQKPINSFPLKHAIWQLTPKGINVLQHFCQRNGITQPHVMNLIQSSRNTMQLVTLERDSTTDKLSHDRATVEVIFRRFVGQDGPNVTTLVSSDSDSIHDYYNGLVGVRMVKDRKIGDRTLHNTFTGKAAVDWLMDCCTTVDRRETFEIASSFVQLGLITCVLDDRVYLANNPREADFQPTKQAIYVLTEKGQRVAGWISREKSTDSNGSNATKKPTNQQNGAASRPDGPRETNTNRLTVILSDAALRLLFREHLRDTHCEENLSFYLDVVEFTSTFRVIARKNEPPKIDTVRETLAAAYGLYNAFLAPGSPCELNIDHQLRNSLASRMTRAVGDDQGMVTSLREVADLFDEAQNQVFKLMASDSVPKFLKEPKYASILREHDFEGAVAGHQHAPHATPERSMSKLARYNGPHERS